MGRGNSKIKGFLGWVRWISFSLLLLILIFSFRRNIFEVPYSTVVLDADRQLIGARIASDEQWRFPVPDSVPEKFRVCIFQKEDRFFKYHPGFNPVALCRALYLNLSLGKVVSGGSTLTMQVIRLSLNNPPRTILQKVREIFLAVSLEAGNTKEDILNMYVSHAPFGGNVVGLEAASWRYFKRPAHMLSWAENATLAVLPNAPGLIHPGRNRKALEERRNELLKILRDRGLLDQQSYELALLESIPEQPEDIPNNVPHLTDHLARDEAGKIYTTTLDPVYQRLAESVLQEHSEVLRGNRIYNGAVLLIDNANGAVKAYVGNVEDNSFKHGEYNDMIRAQRSSGSILKPFLYANMLSDGEMLPKELMPDIPTIIAGFKPENFIKKYDGAVPANEALARSLNIPAVWGLREHGIDNFKKDLTDIGFTTITRSTDNYGLSLILGGAEVSPWDLGKAYYNMASKLQSYRQEGKTVQQVHILKNNSRELDLTGLNRGAIYKTFEALKKVNRPESEMGWQYFRKPNIAWKTGTSFGFRDAWAVGITSGFTCVVWVGNADGEGRPGLIGAQAAGPVLFDIMNALPQSPWFDEPHDDMKPMLLCEESGMIATRHCESSDTIYCPDVEKPFESCPYHQTIYTDRDENFRVTLNCVEADEMKRKNWFILPPSQAWFYSKNTTDYKPLPPWKEGCANSTEQLIGVIYPRQNAEIFIPRELDGRDSKIIVEAAHQRKEAVLFWHLNGQYVGRTESFHQMPLFLKEGTYILHLEDAEGNFLDRRFKISSGSLSGL